MEKEMEMELIGLLRGAVGAFGYIPFFIIKSMRAKDHKSSRI
jgi:hypothetical protein